jgi:hypothetical protein
MGNGFILKFCHFGHLNFIPAFGDAFGIVKLALKMGGAGSHLINRSSWIVNYESKPVQYPCERRLQLRWIWLSLYSNIELRKCR